MLAVVVAVADLDLIMVVQEQVLPDAAAAEVAAVIATIVLFAQVILAELEEIALRLLALSLPVLQEEQVAQVAVVVPTQEVVMF